MFVEKNVFLEFYIILVKLSCILRSVKCKCMILFIFENQLEFDLYVIFIIINYSFVSFFLTVTKL